MKRDLDLIRTLLMRLEEIDVPAGHCMLVGPDDLQVESYSGEQIAYHIQLLKSANFVREINTRTRRYSLNYAGLSWAGHEFLDSVRDDEIWQRTRSALKAAGGFTFDLVADMAKAFLKDQLQRHTGLALGA